MTPLVLSYNPVTARSILAHNHITRFLAETFKASVIDSPTLAVEAPASDRIFLVNGMAQYAPHRHTFYSLIADCLKRGGEFFYCLNDYAIRPDTPVRQFLKHRNARLLSTVQGRTGWLEQGEYVNWNALTVYDSPYRQHNLRQFPVVYHGAFRRRRVSSFDRYLDSPLMVLGWHTARVAYKFLARYPRLRIAPADELLPFLASASFALYIQDSAPEKAFDSLANRFYEYLSAGCVVLFDQTCRGTLEKQGIPPSEFERFIIRGPADLGPWVRRRQERASLAARQWDWLERYQLRLTPARLTAIVEGRK